ncbi:hypothetical protein HF520_00570 [Romboutsia sp. CE17]|uniref:DUF6602 domain-containing protein n=1 Tax=Romboutsia sp. CE17 TaxID=2724150 RepID=UPI001442A6BE|nr:DUF6602 domain-containing protein [Romboutsia sp. CE17]QJA07529.1 hypothetical protein HF520_00570 [Romboutsia sp. CE17]
MVDKSKKMDIKILFNGLQEQMKCKLTTNRSIIQHPGTKGDASELNWIEILRKYLPKRYSVDKAFIVDCYNNISDQIDIVIYDRQYSPFVFNQDDVKYIPAESIYAIFEVKQELNKDNILYASDKAKSVRRLHRTSAKIYHAGGCHPPKAHSKILAGILTLSCSWSEGLGSTFKKNMKELCSNGELNLGCILESGSFKYNDDVLEIKDGDNALMSFFLNLLIELQKLGTIPAMDINYYLDALDRE